MISKFQRDTLKRDIRTLARTLYDAGRIRYKLFDSLYDATAYSSKVTSKKLKMQYEQLKEVERQEVRMTKAKKPYKLSKKQFKKIKVPEPTTLYIMANIKFTDTYYKMDKFGESKAYKYDRTAVKYASVNVDGRNDDYIIEDAIERMYDEVENNTPDTEVRRTMNREDSNIQVMDKAQFKTQNVALQHVKMYRANPIKYNFLDAKLNASLSNTCCIDYLANTFENVKGLKKVMTTEHLTKYFENLYYKLGQCCKTNNDLDYGILNTEPFDGGISTFMLRIFCEEHNIPLYALDIDNKVFEKLNADPKRNTYPAIMYYVMDNHMYPIEDKRTRQSIVKAHCERENVASYKSASDGESSNKAQIEMFSRQIMEDMDVDDITKHNNINVFYEDNLKDILLKLFEKKNTIYKCAVSQGKIAAIYDVADGVNLFHNPHYKQSKEICELLKIPFRNQSMGQLCNEIMKDMYKPLPKISEKCPTDKFNDMFFTSETLSAFNREVYDIMNGDDIRNIAFTDFYDYPEEGKPLYAFDCRRCYRNCLYNNKYKLPVFSVFDMPKPYTGDDLRPGFYFIKSKNYFPLRGNGWYSVPTVEYALEQNIITKDDIEFELVASSTLKHDYFIKFIEHVEKALPADLAKMLINSMTGTLGMKTIKYERAYYTKSKNDVARYLCTFGNDANVSPMNDEEEPLYQILIKNKLHIEDTNLPIYYYLIEMGNIELHKLYNLVNKPNSRLIGLKTDCVVMQYEQPINFTLDDAKYKEDVPPNNFKLRNREPRTCFYNIPDMPWTEIYDDSDDFTSKAKEIVDMDSSIHINGYAGCGKTTLIKEIKKELEAREKKFICLAPTNKACRHIGGKTLHKFFGIACNKKKPNLKSLLRYVDYIFIDEISMVKSVFYKMFLTLKKNNPHLKFIIAGDFHQLPPVNDGDYDYADSLALYALCKGVKLELVKCRRSDDIMFKICLSVLKGKEVKHLFGKEQTYKNICYTNRMRRHVNAVCMKKWINEKNPDVVVHVAKNKDDKQSQDMVLSVNMPLIASQSNMNIGIINNETFVIKEIDEEQMKVINDLGEMLTIKYNDINKNFYPAFAITCHKAQGDTINEPYTIYEWERFPSVNMKYVALSRSSNKKHVNFCDFKLSKTTYTVGNVYKIVNDVNKEVYVGSTVNTLEARFNQHKRGGLSCHEHFNEIGWEHCHIQLIEELHDVSLHELRLKETFWIKQIGTLNKCTPN